MNDKNNMWSNREEFNPYPYEGKLRKRSLWQRYRWQLIAIGSLALMFVFASTTLRLVLNRLPNQLEPPPTLPNGQTSTPSIGQTTLPTAVPTVTPGTINMNKRLTCGGCDNPIVTTINTITFDPDKQRMVWNITLYNTSGENVGFHFDEFNLQDLYNQSNQYQGTGSILDDHDFYISTPIASGQTLQVEAIFSFNPLRTEPYKLIGHYRGTYPNDSDIDVTFDPTEFTF